MTRVLEPAGHRIVPTVPVTIEGWAPGRAECFTCLLLALADSFVDTSDVEATEPAPVVVEPGSDQDMAADLIEAVIELMQALDVVPVHATVEECEAGGLVAYVGVVRPDRARLVGPIPRGVERREVLVGDDGERWWARARLLT